MFNFDIMQQTLAVFRTNSEYTITMLPSQDKCPAAGPMPGHICLSYEEFRYNLRKIGVPESKIPENGFDGTKYIDY